MTNERMRIEMNETNKKSKKFCLTFLGLILLSAILSASAGPSECSEIWEAVSNDYREAVESLGEGSDETQDQTRFVSRDENPGTVEIEYDGKIISVDIRDLILMADASGDKRLELDDPAKYESQLETAPLYGVKDETESYENTVTYEDDGVYALGADTAPAPGQNVQEITEREYEEQKRAREWSEVFEDLTLREIDDKALELVKEFGTAKDAVPPITGAAGSVVITWSSYTPKIVCRPLYVTDIILQPASPSPGYTPAIPSAGRLCRAYLARATPLRPTCL
jgi:hypothetical protein